MLDYFFGLLLLGLGIHTPAHPSVLGDDTVNTEDHITPTGSQSISPTGAVTGIPTNEDHRGSNAGESGDSSRTVVTNQVKLTKDQVETFQKERKTREEKIKSVSEKRSDDFEKSFLEVEKHREQEDQATRTAFTRKVNTFKNADKQKKALALDTAYKNAITKALSSMQSKLTSMLTLLDKISVAAASLKTQGKDTSHIDTDITSAQTKVTAALTLLKNITATVPTALSVSGESSASKEIGSIISQAKTALIPLYTAFTDARKAVGVALQDLEALTAQSQVTPTPTI
jgi:hypothetical protein